MELNDVLSIKENSNSYLSFKIGNEIYCVHVAHVHNIIKVPEITYVPNVPKFFKGVINLRGTVLPLIDTRVKLEMAPTKITELTSVIVLEVKQDSGFIRVGAMVDSLQEVLEIDENEINPPPNIKGLDSANEVILGIVNKGDGFFILLDIDALFNFEIIKNFSKIKVGSDIV